MTSEPPDVTVEINGFAMRTIRVLMGVGTQELAERCSAVRPGGVTDAYIRKIEIGVSQRVSGIMYRELLSALAIKDRRVLLANPHASDPATAVDALTESWPRSDSPAAAVAPGGPGTAPASLEPAPTAREAGAPADEDVA